MNSIAKELFAKAGYSYSYEISDGVQYSDSSLDYGEHLGDSVIIVYFDGGFDAYVCSNHEGDTPISFTPEMSKALVKQIDEFNKLKGDKGI